MREIQGMIMARSSDLEWDYAFHFGPPDEGHMNGPHDFDKAFKDLHALPMNQRLISPFHGLRIASYIWNALMLKYSHPIDLRTVIDRIIRFRKDCDLDDGEGPTFIVRVDDFPRFDVGTERYMEFHDIAKENDVEYLLGVTPFLTDDPFTPSSVLPSPLEDAEMDLLKELKADGVEFALHGVTHRTLYKRYHTETVGLPSDELERIIGRAKAEFARQGFDVPVYMPPFNTLDMANFLILGEHFKAITGGPESIPTMGPRLSPSSIGGTPFVPVYHPFYDSCRNVMQVLSKDPFTGIRAIPLAIHWNWEIGSDFVHFEELCGTIHGRTMPWSSIWADG